MSEPNILEIHSHSTVSDGAYSPKRLAELMAEHGVDLWSLTDHDSARGCHRAAEAATEVGVEFVSGIEISARLDGTSIHVLGYGFDPDDERLGDYGEEMVSARDRRMKAMIDRLDELGYPVEFDEVKELAGGGNVGRPHLAQAVVERGYVDELQEVFDRWLEDGGPAYVALARPTVEEAIQMIDDAGGVAVLAHPARYGDVSGQFAAWRDAGLWGLEVRHPSHTPRDEERLAELADEHGFGKTASNDWHGNKEGAAEVLGEVVFPRRWRREFLQVLDETFWQKTPGY